MIPVSNIIAFSVALILTTAFPAVLLIILAIKKRITGLPLLFGVLAFLISQVLIRLPLMGILANHLWYQQFATMVVPFIIFTAFTAGVFEESARLGGALLLKKQRNYKDIISFGLGHGLCEVVAIVGLAHVNNILFSLAINNQGADNDLVALTLGSLPPQTLSILTEQLIAATPSLVAIGILERFGAVAFHIFATFLIFKGVITHQKLRYYILAILAHTAANAITLFVFRAAGPIVAVTVLLLLGFAMGWYVWKQRKVLPDGI